MKITEKQVEKVISNIKNCYRNKYNDNDYKTFKDMTLGKKQEHLTNYVSRYFDLNIFDSRDMVN